MTEPAQPKPAPAKPRKVVTKTLDLKQAVDLASLITPGGRVATKAKVGFTGVKEVIKKAKTLDIPDLLRRQRKELFEREKELALKINREIQQKGGFKLTSELPKPPKAVTPKIKELGQGSSPFPSDPSKMYPPKPFTDITPAMLKQNAAKLPVNKQLGILLQGENAKKAIAAASSAKTATALLAASGAMAAYESTVSPRAGRFPISGGGGFTSGRSELGLGVSAQVKAEPKAAPGRISTAADPDLDDENFAFAPIIRTPADDFSNPAKAADPDLDDENFTFAPIIRNPADDFTTPGILTPPEITSPITPAVNPNIRPGDARDVTTEPGVIPAPAEVRDPATITPIPTTPPTITPIPTTPPTITPIPTTPPTITPIPTTPPTITPIPTTPPTESPVITETPTITPVITKVPTETPVITTIPTETPTIAPVITKVPTETGTPPPPPPTKKPPPPPPTKPPPRTERGKTIKRPVTTAKKPPRRLPGLNAIKPLKIKPGVNPRVVQWRQGKKFKSVDLQTGRKSTTDQPIGAGVRPGKTPAETLKVIKTTRSRIRRRRIDLGAVIAIVGSNRIRFERDPSPRVRGMRFKNVSPTRRENEGLIL